MTGQKILDLVFVFFRDGRVLAILALVLMDLGTGIAAAIKTKKFEWDRVGDFYRTAVVPNMLGYLTFYLAGKVVGGSNVLGPASFLLSESVLWIVWVALITPFLAAIVANAQKLGYTIPPAAEEPPA